MRHAMIMAGGAGTRLWPMSRIELPKQVIPFLPDADGGSGGQNEGRSLLSLAVARIEPLIDDPARRWVCTNERFRSIVETLGIPAAQILGEPIGRDTVNAVGFSAAIIAKQDPDAVMAVLTADHVIEPVDQFVAALQSAFELVESQPETIVTFGIVPDHPSTGYGYIEHGVEIEYEQSAPAMPPAYVALQYVEKPDARTAARYMTEGTYWWSSGMFVFKATRILQAIARYLPEAIPLLNEIADAWGTPEQTEVLARVYPQLPKISFDYAIMEPVSKDPESQLATVPMDLRWLDVGSWNAVADVLQSTADERGNCGIGTRIMADCSNVLSVSDDSEHTIAAIGCEDLVIIHTGDATLICPADRTQDIKDLVEKLDPKLR